MVDVGVVYQSGPVTTKMKSCVFLFFFFPIRYLRVLDGYLQVVGKSFVLLCEEA